MERRILRDSQEQAVTTDSLNAINDFFEQLLSVGNNGQVILEVVEANQTCAMLYGKPSRLLRCYRFYGNAHVAAFLNAAKANLKRANERKQLYIAAIDSWIKRDITKAMPYGKLLTRLRSSQSYC